MKKVKYIILIIIICLALLAISIYNSLYVNPYQLKIRNETLKSYKISNKLDGLTIAYFSDLYFNDGLDTSYFDLTINTLNDINADIVIFGGDLTNHFLNDEETKYITNGLKKINAKIAKYYVLGECDYDYKELVDSIMSSANFKLLDNNTRRINYNNSYFYLTGLDSSNLDASCLSSIESSCFNLVVAHYPDTFDRIKDLTFDYMLAGHSLGGPVYVPIISFFNRPLGAQKYFHGKSSYNLKQLDITNGVGLIDKNSARFLADAEIVLYKLKSSN